MERRQSERIRFNSDAKITSEGKTFSGSIENISEDGMEYLITSYVQASEGFTPEKRVGLDLHAPSGEMLHLTCEVKWFVKPEVEGDTLMLGMEIINPTMKYRELIRSLYLNNSNEKEH